MQTTVGTARNRHRPMHLLIGVALEGCAKNYCITCRNTFFWSSFGGNTEALPLTERSYGWLRLETFHVFDSELISIDDGQFA